MNPTAAQIKNAHNGRWSRVVVANGGKKTNGYLPEREPGWYVTVACRSETDVNLYSELRDIEVVEHAWHQVAPGDRIVDLGWCAPKSEGRQVVHLYT